jgi:hypothetical protein
LRVEVLDDFFNPSASGKETVGATLYPRLILLVCLGKICYSVDKVIGQEKPALLAAARQIS